LDGPGREGVASAILLGSNGTSPPFVRAPAEDRSKYEKLIYDFEDVSSDDSHSSQPEIGNGLSFLIITSLSSAKLWINFKICLNTSNYGQN
jgi:hypothetical protein